MKKLRQNGLSPVTLGMFVVAIILLLASTIGGARAALAYYSEDYTSQFEMFHIGITLNENGKAVSTRDYDGDGEWTEETGELLDRDLEKDGGIILGKAYKEELSVTNSGDIDEYVRVTVDKYWLDKDGGKMQTLSPELINLNLLCDETGNSNGWLLDKEASNSEYAKKKGVSGERTVLYYNKILAKDEETPKFSDKITIDGFVASKVSQTTEKNGKYTTITTTYDYDGVSFRIEATADAVQTHNAEDAALSAWGREISIADSGALSLK